MQEKEFGFIRHAPKKSALENDLEKTSEEPKLNPVQLEKWNEAIKRLEIEGDPQVSRKELPLIEKKATDIYESLPEESLVIFSSTDYPRTKLTADLISSTLLELEREREEKKIRVASLWEHDEIEDHKLKDVGSMQDEARRNQALMREIYERDFPNDQEFKEYLESKGDKTFNREDEMLRRAVNFDLQSDDSQYRKRAKTLREELKSIEKLLDELDGPVFFYMAGHHPNLIALDVAVNHRSYYDSEKELPKPLDLWKVDKEKLIEFINSDKD